MSAARLCLLAGVVLCLAVLAYLVQVAKRKRPFTVCGALFAVGVAVVGLLLANAGVHALSLVRP